jgi:hypothetical protein
MVQDGLAGAFTARGHDWSGMLNPRPQPSQKPHHKPAAPKPAKNDTVKLDDDDDQLGDGEGWAAACRRLPRRMAPHAKRRRPAMVNNGHAVPWAPL